MFPFSHTHSWYIPTSECAISEPLSVAKFVFCCYSCMLLAHSIGCMGDVLICILLRVLLLATVTEALGGLGVVCGVDFLFIGESSSNENSCVRTLKSIYCWTTGFTYNSKVIGIFTYKKYHISKINKMACHNLNLWFRQKPNFCE